MKYLVIWTLLIVLSPSVSLASSHSVKIKSVKSLTHMLSKIEKNHGSLASLTTMRLQIYLEDVYISQGTTLFIKHHLISAMIVQGIDQGMSRAQLSKYILRQFKRSELNESL